MSFELPNNYTNVEDWTFDPAAVDMGPNGAELKVSEQDADWIEDFTSSDNFNFDPQLLEFISGSLRQKPQVSDYMAGYKWNSFFDANYTKAGVNQYPLFKSRT